MIRHRAAWLLVATLTIVPACTQPNAAPVQKELELGSQRVQVSVPDGWDLLDQGAEKRFRQGESDIVLENLGRVDSESAFALLHDDQRREVKSRRAITIDNHDAVDIETWSRLDHSWPQRLLFVRIDADLLALHMTRQADAETAKAFESIRDSLHFSASARR